MGAVDQPQRQSKSKGTGLRRPKRRVGIRIDMTPMVDIAFLLLIFYMVTTIFSAPQSMEIVLPPKDAKDPAPIGKSNLLELMVDVDGNIFWQNDRADKPMPLPEYLPKQNLRKFLLEKNQQNDRLVTIIRLEKNSKFDNMVNIFDEIQVVERLFKQTNPSWSYKRSLQDMTEWEFQLVEKAKATMGGIPRPVGGTS